MNKTQAGRLLTLAWYLRTQVKPENFNLSWYIDSKLVPNVCRVSDLPECGTSACALGHATSVWPESFRLRLFSLQAMVRGKWKPSFCNGTPVCEFFGVNTDEARFAFSGDHTRTPKQESHVLEQLALKHGWTYA